jgi:hypothetical protein
VTGRGRRHVPGRAARRDDRRPRPGGSAPPCRGSRPGRRRPIPSRTCRANTSAGRPQPSPPGRTRHTDTRRTRKRRHTRTQTPARHSPDRLIHLTSGRRRRPHARLMPNPGKNHNLVFFRQRGKPAPGPRFAEIPHLGNDQFRKPLALQYRPGGQPGQNPRGQDVQPEVGVAERQTENGENDDVRQSDCREHGYLADRQRHRQPEVVQLVEPLLDPPDIRVSGQIHRLHPFRSRGYQWTPSALAMPVASVCTMLGV